MFPSDCSHVKLQSIFSSENHSVTGRSPNDCGISQDGDAGNLPSTPGAPKRSCNTISYKRKHNPLGLSQNILGCLMSLVYLGHIARLNSLAHLYKSRKAA